MIKNIFKPFDNNLNSLLPIRFDNVSLKLNNNFFFNKLSFEINTKDISVFIGSNGAGKTSCIKVLAGALSILKEEGLMDECTTHFRIVNPKSITMGQLYGNRMVGLHLNFIVAPFKSPRVFAHRFIASLLPSLLLSAEDRKRIKPAGEEFMSALQETGYMHIHATKPDTVAMPLMDSPVGLAGYILEKFSTWTNPAYRQLPDGGLTEKFDLDDLLTNVMIYWYGV